VKKTEEIELQRLTSQKRLTFGELQRERILWNKYFDEKEQNEKWNSQDNIK
jgi:hypothetical protein